jgi:hypothetical protein
MQGVRMGEVGTVGVAETAVMSVSWSRACGLPPAARGGHGECMSGEDEYAFGAKIDSDVGDRVHEALEQIAAAAALSHGELRESPKELATMDFEHYVAERLGRAEVLLAEARSFLGDS